ncbi:hypothetical protein ABFX02_14G303200 [Erythranthe guttata]
MSISKHLIITSLFMSLLIFHHLVEANAPNHQISSNNGGGTSPFVAKLDCGKACAARCRLSSRPNLCNRACGTCCGRCNCVPPGTSGNQEVCPCYYTMTTHGGKRKCP